MWRVRGSSASQRRSLFEGNCSLFWEEWENRSVKGFDAQGKDEAVGIDISVMIDLNDDGPMKLPEINYLPLISHGFCLPLLL